MKNATITKSLVLSIGLAVGVTTALAQPFPGETWTLNENGPALLNGPVVGFSNGVLQRDPISGVTTLFYPLSGPNFPSAPGDVLLLEPPSPSQGSDLLRFDGHGGVYFFSDAEAAAPDGDLADVGVPPAV